MFRKLSSAHSWLLKLDQRSRKDPYSPKRIRHFLDYLGKPQECYKVVHVGGTSGKGSVVQMISAILKEAGYKVGTTVSPYLFSPLEKIQINQKNIAPRAFVKLVNQYRDLILKFNLSYFEAYIALTLIYFAQRKVDYAIVEVGLGGRLDATNVFSNPALAIITNIGLDHTEMLGHTLKQIAREKAAIIKDPRKALTGSKLIKKAEYIDTRYKIQDIRYKTNLLGEFQKGNAILAVAAAKKLGIKNKDIKKGLLSVKHPGRFEIIKRKPLIIRDGAHNPEKMKALVSALQKYFKLSRYRQRYLLLAIKNTKDYRPMLKIICPLFDQVILTSFAESYNPRILQKEIKGSRVIHNPHQAWAYLTQHLSKQDFGLVTGSLYLLGEVFKK